MKVAWALIVGLLLVSCSGGVADMPLSGVPPEPVPITDAVPYEVVIAPGALDAGVAHPIAINVHCGAAVLAVGPDGKWWLTRDGEARANWLPEEWAELVAVHGEYFVAWMTIDQSRQELVVEVNDRAVRYREVDRETLPAELTACS